MPAWNRCTNRPQGQSGTRIRWVHVGQPVGVSEAVGTMFLPENGTKHQNVVTFYRCSLATLEVSLDEFFYVPEGRGVTSRFCFAIGESCGEVSVRPPSRILAKCRGPASSHHSPPSCASATNSNEFRSWRIASSSGTSTQTQLSSLRKNRLVCSLVVAILLMKHTNHGYRSTKNMLYLFQESFTYIQNFHTSKVFRIFW